MNDLEMMVEGDCRCAGGGRCSRMDDDDNRDHEEEDDDDHVQEEDQPEWIDGATTVPPEHPRRRILGRAARRRQRKFKEICAMEQQLLLNMAPTATTTTVTPVNDTITTTNNTTTTIATSTTSTTNPHPQVLPTDRDRIWPAVLEQRRTTWTTADNVTLTGQLGYVPGNAIRVVCRMRDLGTMTPMLLHRPLSSSSSVSLAAASVAAAAEGSNFMVDDDQSPVVIQLYPLVYRNPHLGGKSGGKRFKLRKRQKVTASNGNNNDDAAATKSSDDDPMLIEPFPTIYWLTHPLLRCIVSKLELEGYGIHLERRLQTDTEAVRQMELAHLAYGQERYSFLTNADRQLIQQLGWDKAFLPTRGVAGISNARAVKCLHAHLAHYLSHRCTLTTTRATTTTNVVGQWVWEEIQLRYTKRTQITTTTTAVTTG